MVNKGSMKDACSRSGEGLVERLFDGEWIRQVPKVGDGRNHDGRREKAIRKDKECSLFGVGVVLENGTKAG